MANDLLRLMSAIDDNREAVLAALPAERTDEFESEYASLTVTAQEHPEAEADTMDSLLALLDRYPQARDALYAADPSLRALAALPAQPEIAAQPPEVPARPEIAAQPPEVLARPEIAAQPQPAARREPSGTSSVWLQWLRELTTTALALLIVGFTVWIAARAVGVVGDDKKTPAIKDLLTILLGPAGVVIGYYFGRAPAEAHAADATRRAESATTERDQVRAKAQQIAKDLENAERMSQPTEARAPSIPVVPVRELQAMRDSLRAI